MESDELDDVELGIQTPAAAGQTRTGYRITLFSCGDDRRPRIGTTVVAYSATTTNESAERDHRGRRQRGHNNSFTSLLAVNMFVCENDILNLGTRKVVAPWVLVLGGRATAARRCWPTNGSFSSTRPPESCGRDRQLDPDHRVTGHHSLDPRVGGRDHAGGYRISV